MTVPAPTELLPCKLCGNPPGQKVGPPAMARCITKGCAGTNLAADTFADWNTRQAASVERAIAGPINLDAEMLRRDAQLGVERAEVAGEPSRKEILEAFQILQGHAGNTTAYKICSGMIDRLSASPPRSEGVRASEVQSAKAYVERAIASYIGDPADNQFQKVFLAALEVVRDEAFSSCGAEPNRHSGAVGAEKRAEQSNPGGGHEVTEHDAKTTYEQKPSGTNPRPDGVAQASPVPAHGRDIETEHFHYDAATRTLTAK